MYVCNVLLNEYAIATKIKTLLLFYVEMFHVPLVVRIDPCFGHKRI